MTITAGDVVVTTDKYKCARLDSFGNLRKHLTIFSTDADVNVDLSSESRGTGSGNSIFEAARDVTVSFGSVLLTKATP